MYIYIYIHVHRNAGVWSQELAWASHAGTAKSSDVKRAKQRLQVAVALEKGQVLPEGLRSSLVRGSYVYMYIYICIHVCMYIYMYVCMCIYIYDDYS